MGRDSFQRLLACLSDGEIHSGESLGDQLGVSRAAIWKHIKTAQTLGVPLKAIRGEGYQTEAGFEMLDAKRIRSECFPDVQSLSDIEILMNVDSTNSYVMKQFQSGCSAPLLVLAETQTAGRGRRGRTWHSPFASSICLTLGWEYAEGLAAIEGLSLVVGLQVVKALQNMGVSDVGLKWPNDVYWRQRKLAGILIDVQGDPAGMCQVAIGVGLNVNLQHVQNNLIDQPWVDLVTVLSLQNDKQSTASNVSRNAVVASLLNYLVPAIKTLPAVGFAAYQQEWQAYDVCFGQPVVVQVGNSVMTGRAAGVNSQSAYGIDISTTEQQTTRHYISGGEISLRIINGSTEQGRTT